MHKDNQGRWHAEVDLPDGRHCYKFRLKSLSPFMLGETVEITDPQARMIDPQNGDASVIVLHDGRDVTTAPDYAWQHDDKPLPQDNELFIYELHVGEFGFQGGRPGTFKDLIGRLDYLRDLGVNAIEIMPVAAFPMGRSWGYNVRHPFAVENAYGSPEDFKHLVDECHARGMRLIMDIVLNHTEVENPLNKIDFHYWFRDTREGEQSFGPKFDYERTDEKLGIRPAFEFGLEVARYWVQEYHIDGYRLDATAVLDNFEFVRAVRETAKSHAGGKPFYLVAEHIPEDPSIAGPEAPCDGAWHQRFEFTAVETLCEAAGWSASKMLGALNPRNDGYVSPGRVVNYIESHDEFTLMQKLGEAGILGEKAARKNKLGATLLFTAVGNPMLYQGQEFGGHRPRDLEIRPLQWELLEADYGLHLKEHYAFLAKLRQDSPALKGEEFEQVYLDEDKRVIAYRRGYGEAEVLVVANLKDEDQTLAIPFPDGAWHELSFNYDLEAKGGKLEDTFPASSAKIYVHRG
jgi:1,4-alpha-glucan branching enzyme